MKSWQKNAALIAPRVALSSLHNCEPALLMTAGNATSRILRVIREKSLKEPPLGPASAEEVITNLEQDFGVFGSLVAQKTLCAQQIHGMVQ